MKQLFTYLLFVWILLPLKAQEKIYTVENIPKVHLQDKTQYVCNPAGILSQEACDKINSMLYDLEQQMGIETVVAVVPSIGDEDSFEFSLQLFNEWGVGKKGKDNGLVIFLVTDQRRIQFITGYGLEGTLPDAICKRIQTKKMIPYLKKEDWDKGMVAGVQAVCKQLNGSMVNGGEADEEIEETEEDEEDSFFILIVVLGIIIVNSVITYFVSRKKSLCPKCKKHKLRRSSTKFISKINGTKTEDVTYTCLNCGYSIVHRQQSSDNDNIVGGSSSYDDGGDFGGGSSGGGGAGSSF